MKMYDKKKGIMLLIIMFLSALLPAYGQTNERYNYRRSSLCLILLTHRDKHYAEAMERVFNNFPLPLRYNDHNISNIRVISVQGKQSRKDIDRMLADNHVARQLVARWFNRNPYTGHMDMDLIHERGGFGAGYDDYQRAIVNMRGPEMLQDEGLELLQYTFVLVCDMDYIDKKNRARWGAFGLAMLGAVMNGMAYANQQNAYNSYIQGNYAQANQQMNNAYAWASGGALANAGAEVVADIGGFKVKMHAYLYRLKWSDENTNEIFSRYWVDYDTPVNEAKEKRMLFEGYHDPFELEYIGDYKKASGKTILRSWSNEDEVILDVTYRCVQKGMSELAKKFEIFRPRAPFYIQNDAMYAHIGTKEEVSYGRKYDIVQPYRDKKGQIQYKKVGSAKASYPWENLYVRFDRYFDTSHPGTEFVGYTCKLDLEYPGLQLRETK